MRSLFIVSSLGLMAAAKETPDAGGGNPSADAKGKAKTVKVKVLCANLGEGPESHKKGDVFETTEDRAKSLGDHVEII